MVNFPHFAPFPLLVYTKSTPRRGNAQTAKNFHIIWLREMLTSKMKGNKLWIN